MADIEKKEGAPAKKADNGADKPAPAKKNKPSLKEKLGKFFRDYKSELKKVVWPSKKQLINNTIVVIVVVLIASVFILLLDMLFGSGMSLILDLAAKL